MEHFRANGLRAVGLCLGGALFAYSPAWAALGGDPASIAADQAQFQAEDSVTSRPLYTIHEMQVSSGTSVREYSALDGTVFAVAWSGPAMPNLRQVLGAHFDEYLAASRANQGGHHYLTAQRGDLVVLSAGSMRGFSGHAVLASALPPGVSIDELR